jgi:hypothetical protein
VITKNVIRIAVAIVIVTIFFIEKAQTDPDMMKTAPKWVAAEESHIIELYGVLP